MSDAPEFIQLHADDDVITVCDRMRFLRGKRVALVWPERDSILQRKLDLVLVQREATRNNVRIALVTHDDEIARNANELNISTFETVSNSRRKRWKRGRSRVFINRSKRPINAPLADELAPYASRVRGEEATTPRSRIIRIVSRVALVAGLAAIFAFVLYLLIPSAQIRIIPASRVVQAQATINADPNLPQALVNVESGQMRATTYRAEIEERGTIPTSGVQSLSSVPAIGTITFINRTNSRIEVPAGSLVSTSAGTPIIFRTTADAIVPGGIGEQVEAPIEAVQESTGDVGNVDIGLINSMIGPLAEQVDVRNFTPTFGGENRIARIVTADDREALISVLRQQMQERAFRELAPMATDGQFIIPETIRIIEERNDWMIFDHDVGDFADNLTLTMRAVVAVTAIDEELAQQITYARLGSQVPRGWAIAPDSLDYQRSNVTDIDASGRVTFEMSASADIQAQINIAALQSTLSGKSSAEAFAYLASNFDLQDDTQPEISISPQWLGRLPILPLRINIDVGEAGSP